MRKPITSQSITSLAIGVLAASLVFGAGLAGAKSSKSKKPKTKTVTIKCTSALNNQAEDGDNVVLPSDSGPQFGRVKCNRSGLTSGVMSDTYTIPDSGDTVGKYTRWFPRGSISGTFDMTPDGGGYGEDFQSQALAGTITVKRGTGIYKGIVGKPKGKMTCTSPDSVHLTCQDSVKVVLPSTAH